MDEELKRKGGEAGPQLLNLIPNERDWSNGGGGEVWTKRGGIAEEVKDLELRLGLPVGKDDGSSAVASPCFTTKCCKSVNINSCAGAKRGFLDLNEDVKKKEQVGLFQLHNRVGPAKERPKQTNGGKGEQQNEHQESFDKKSAHGSDANSSSQTRNSGSPVVGWPPIRSSFRKNLASTSSKPSVELPPPSSNACDSAKLEEPKKGLLVKINMDGIPIGRKIDLKSLDSYEKLSLAVEELFQGLLAVYYVAQMEPSSSEATLAENKHVFKGLLDGTGQYTLVYDDNEGDRMLVGDVPWDMFVSTAKRLRVLKSSDLSALRLGATGRTTATD